MKTQTIIPADDYCEDVSAESKRAKKPAKKFKIPNANARAKLIAKAHGKGRAQGFIRRCARRMIARNAAAESPEAALLLGVILQAVDDLTEIPEKKYYGEEDEKGNPIGDPTPISLDAHDFFFTSRCEPYCQLAGLESSFVRGVLFDLGLTKRRPS